MDNRRSGNDEPLIDELSESETPSQGGSSGGNVQRTVGQRDELKTAMGEDPMPTQISKRDKKLPEDKTNLSEKS